jgi:hypothetical protein
MLEGIVTEKRFQMSFEYSACRVANTLRAELHAAGLNRGEISCLEFVLLNRSATLTGGYRVNVNDWGGDGKRTLAAHSCGGPFGGTCAHYCA